MLCVSPRTAVLLLATAFAVTGCEPEGPPSVRATSATVGPLAARVAFLERYVKFRRTYESLDFDLMYQNNNGGGVPGPSDWDMRLVATVPAAELDAWIPPGTTPTTAAAATADWLKSVPTTLDLSGVNEWYARGGWTVGLDRQRRIVVYQSTTTPSSG